MAHPSWNADSKGPFGFTELCWVYLLMTEWLFGLFSGEMLEPHDFMERPHIHLLFSHAAVGVWFTVWLLSPSVEVTLETLNITNEHQ